MIEVLFLSTCNSRTCRVVEWLIVLLLDDYINWNITTIVKLYFHHSCSWMVSVDVTYQLRLFLQGPFWWRLHRFLGFEGRWPTWHSSGQLWALLPSSGRRDTAQGPRDSRKSKHHWKSIWISSQNCVIWICRSSMPKLQAALASSGIFPERVFLRHPCDGSASDLGSCVHNSCYLSWTHVSEVQNHNDKNPSPLPLTRICDRQTYLRHTPFVLLKSRSFGVPSAFSSTCFGVRFVWRFASFNVTWSDVLPVFCQDFRVLTSEFGRVPPHLSLFLWDLMRHTNRPPCHPSSHNCAFLRGFDMFWPVAKSSPVNL